MKNVEELDIVSFYFDQMKKYQLLTNDEELELVKDLKILDDSLILDNSRKIDFEKVFYSFNNMNYEEVGEFLNYFEKIIKNFNNNSEILNTILKYKRIYNKLNRVLNFDDLNEYFKYNNSNIEKLEKIDLYKELEKYAKYYRAREKMINSNLRLVVSIAKGYKKTNIEFEDLIFEGNIGLVRAVDKFNPDLGVRFSTYATYWIKQKILRYIYSNNSLLSISSSQLEKIIKFNEELKKLKKENNKEYSVNELSKLLSLDEITVSEYLRYSNFVLSLDQPIGEDDSVTFGELIEDDTQNIDMEVDKKLLVDDISKIMELLNDREREILNLRYGLTTENNRVYTLDDVAKLLNVTREYVRKIENSALHKLRNNAIKNGISRSLRLYM